MDRDTDRSCLVGNGSGDSLADPPCGIRTELISLPVIEFFYCLDKTQISLLDQIQKQHPTSHIALRNADYETQVGFRKLFLGFLITFLHPLGQTDLLIRAQQRYLSDFL